MIINIVWYISAYNFYHKPCSNFLDICIFRSLFDYILQMNGKIGNKCKKISIAELRDYLSERKYTKYIFSSNYQSNINNFTLRCSIPPLTFWQRCGILQSEYVFYKWACIPIVVADSCRSTTDSEAVWNVVVCAVWC